MKTSWFSFQAKETDNATIDIFGDIGEGGVTDKDFIQELRALGSVKKIRVSINSLGGDFFQANAIHNALKDHGAEITVEILGIAASAASIIVMAGKTVVMPQSSFLFIHNPQALVLGEEKDLITMADALRKIGGAMKRIYSQKSGKSEEVAAVWMNDATWFTAQQALDVGLADVVTDAVQLVANAGIERFASHKNLPAPLRALINPFAASTAAEIYQRRNKHHHVDVR